MEKKPHHKRLSFTRKLIPKQIPVCIVAFTLVFFSNAPAQGQQLINGNFTSTSLSPWHWSLNWWSYWDLLDSSERYCRPYRTSRYDSSQLWANLPAYIPGFDTLDTKGHGFIFDLYSVRNGYTDDTNNLYLMHQLNLDTMMNFGWSMELTEPLATHKAYRISCAMNVGQTFQALLFKYPDVKYDDKDIYGCYAQQWYMRIGISDDPHQAGDSIGRIDNTSYTYTGESYFENLSILEAWDSVKEYYIYRYFENQVQVIGTTGKYLTFRFYAIPKIGPYLQNKRSVLSCAKLSEYAIIRACLDDISIACVSHIQDTLCMGTDTVLLTTTNPKHRHIWSTGDTSQRVYITRPGTYWVQTNHNGCIGHDTITITEWGCDTAIIQSDTPVLPLYIPNAFSPNDDGLNDSFGIIHEYLTMEKLAIYSMWGEKMYSGNQSWLGTYLQEPAPSGVYLYVMQVRDPVTNNIQNLKGSLYLVR
jgi:gliding motility-associated-like protein